ncbi:MAG: hypothetical protein ACLP3C_18535 [Mycobacterium sp.]|uniref:hypothetical protein n=1 Tax=Mycobacterium sp. TaxID=1785 RepID=UPI003C5B0A93
MERAVEVYVAGLQKPGGRVHRDIVTGELHPDNPITIEQAEQLAAALLDATKAAGAADELDGWTR